VKSPSLQNASGGEEPLVIRVERRGDRLLVTSGLPVLRVAIMSLALLVVAALGPWDRQSWWAPVSVIGAAALFWSFSSPWRLSVDRRAGRATLRKGFWYQRRPLGALTGVRVWSPLQAHIERVRREQTVMPYAPPLEVYFVITLLDGAGRRWKVTRTRDDRTACGQPERAEADRAARQLSTYLGIQLLHPYETPPGGAVPPPLEDGGAPR
jgi:hypothetical protein